MPREIHEDISAHTTNPTIEEINNMLRLFTPEIRDKVSAMAHHLKGDEIGKAAVQGLQLGRWVEILPSEVLVNHSKSVATLARLTMRTQFHLSSLVNQLRKGLLPAEVLATCKKDFDYYLAEIREDTDNLPRFIIGMEAESKQLAVMQAQDKENSDPFNVTRAFEIKLVAILAALGQELFSGTEKFAESISSVNLEKLLQQLRRTEETTSQLEATQEAVDQGLAVLPPESQEHFISLQAQTRSDIAKAEAQSRENYDILAFELLIFSIVLQNLEVRVQPLVDGINQATSRALPTPS